MLNLTMPDRAEPVVAELWHRNHRQRRWTAGRLLLTAVVLGSCSTQPGAPPPPTIEVVGLIRSVEIHPGFVRYLLEPDRVWDAQDGRYRVLRPGAGGGELLLAGTDLQGSFVATFQTQDGLPSGCYVENAVGIERGAYLEIRGVMWAKEPGFASDPEIPARDAEYPSGTRFCFDAAGRVASAVGP
jgi:hypothetical protein